MTPDHLVEDGDGSKVGCRLQAREALQTEFAKLHRANKRLRFRQECASKARIIERGGFHPESCRLIGKLTSGARRSRLTF